ncbi:hypothetical protein CPI40_09070 [Moraxella catarrhalis]|uniref:Uncharacterized protein n=1 Tax=Moraxella catarrhalis TaxID=480 RepID=A0A198WVM2_MORCA|nr:hypothetical protein [Moraxella catarrhalis]MPW75245.1 hypothetical protein [Moraxella catarrhalis]OAV15737.1 hypothetical protein AO376_0412 [Moraxella catarrhalis]OAV19489.1 hypothetical protein AO374_0691 [Moraxella catarrhalis]OAV23933.1 hypothetical protein AO370_1537 [Moraxella catarrhalis]
MFYHQFHQTSKVTIIHTIWQNLCDRLFKLWFMQGFNNQYHDITSTKHQVTSSITSINGKII